MDWQLLLYSIIQVVTYSHRVNKLWKNGEALFFMNTYIWYPETIGLLTHPLKESKRSLRSQVQSFKTLTIIFVCSKLYYYTWSLDSGGCLSRLQPSVTQKWFAHDYQDFFMMANFRWGKILLPVTAYWSSWQSLNVYECHKLKLSKNWRLSISR